MPISKNRRALNRLRHTCLNFSRQAEYTHFITVGYDTRYLKMHLAASQHMSQLFAKIRDYLRLMGLAIVYFWLLSIGEIEKKPHFHAMIQLAKGYQLTEAGLRKWWGKGNVDIQPVYDQKRLVYYCTKINDPFLATPYSRDKLKKIYGHSHSPNLAQLQQNKVQKCPISQFFIETEEQIAHLPEEPKAVQTYTSTETYFQIFPRLQFYLERLLPKQPQGQTWDYKTVCQKLSRAYLVLPQQFDDTHRSNRGKDKQNLFIRCQNDWLNTIPPTNVTDLAKLVRCQKRPGKNAWLVEGKKFHDHLERKYQGRPIVALHTENWEEGVKGLSFQVREQTIREYALSLTGRLDHLLMDEDGFVVRDDKYTQRTQGWHWCYVPAVFQVHAYAYLVACRFPQVPCRALQVCVHPKGTEETQVFTIKPDWEWFIPLMAQALLGKWGLDSQLKKCPPDCQGRSECRLITPYPHKIEYEKVSREELDQLFDKP